MNFTQCRRIKIIWVTVNHLMTCVNVKFTFKHTGKSEEVGQIHYQSINTAATRLLYFLLCYVSLSQYCICLYMTQLNITGASLSLVRLRLDFLSLSVTELLWQRENPRAPMTCSALHSETLFRDKIVPLHFMINTWLIFFSQAFFFSWQLQLHLPQWSLGSWSPGRCETL